MPDELRFPNRRGESQMAAFRRIAHEDIDAGRMTQAEADEFLALALLLTPHEGSDCDV